MGKRTRKVRAVEGDETTLGELIHVRIRAAIEQAVAEELEAALGRRYERIDAEQRQGYRHGTRLRTLTGPTGPVELEVPRARIAEPGGGVREWRSRLVPRYGRRMPEINAAIAAVYLSGGNTRRIRGALAPLLKAAPLSRSAVSRVVATLRHELDAWQQRDLGGIELAYLYLDAIALRVRMGQRVVSVPVLVALGVLADGTSRACSGRGAAVAARPPERARAAEAGRPWGCRSWTLLVVVSDGAPHPGEPARVEVPAISTDLQVYQAGRQGQDRPVRLDPQAARAEHQGREVAVFGRERPERVRQLPEGPGDGGGLDLQAPEERLPQTREGRRRRPELGRIRLDR